MHTFQFFIKGIIWMEMPLEPWRSMLQQMAYRHRFGSCQASKLANGTLEESQCRVQSQHSRWFDEEIDFEIADRQIFVSV